MVDQKAGAWSATVWYSVSISDILHQLLPESIHEQEWLLQEGVVPGIRDYIDLVSSLSHKLHAVFSN